jgi:hypothetical protein
MTHRTTGSHGLPTRQTAFREQFRRDPAVAGRSRVGAASRHRASTSAGRASRAMCRFAGHLVEEDRLEILAGVRRRDLRAPDAACVHLGQQRLHRLVPDVRVEDRPHQLCFGQAGEFRPRLRGRAAQRLRSASGARRRSAASSRACCHLCGQPRPPRRYLRRVRLRSSQSRPRRERGARAPRHGLSSGPCDEGGVRQSDPGMLRSAVRERYTSPAITRTRTRRTERRRLKR